MANKNVKTFFIFDSPFTVERITSELPFLEKLDEMPPHKPECDSRIIEINTYRGDYRVTEQKSGIGGEGGVELVDFYLGEYRYRKKGKGLEEIE